jgi:uncharacterized protein (TIGR03435 family)
MTAEFIVNHLWQSSCIALLASVLALMLRGNAPKVRYWVWLSASLKFLVPFTFLVSLGSVIPQPAGYTVPAPSFSNTLIQVSKPFSLDPHNDVNVPAQTHWGTTALAFLWAAGFIAIAFTRCRKWYGIRAMLRAGTPAELPITIPALITSNAQEPGIVGFLKPVLVLPGNLLGRLNSKQLEALLAHELSHVRRRDNFFAALHMGVEAIFWFHPLVWWIGSRMLEERELACDEEVLRLGCQPTDYARGILTVCELYSEAPLPCVSGVTGADIKKRLKIILRGTLQRELSGRKKLALVSAAIASIAVPVGLGVWNAPVARAQSAGQRGPKKVEASVPPIAFEVASIKANVSLSPNRNIRPEPGRLVVSNMPVKALIGWAYNVWDFQISGGAGWIDSAPYDIEGKVAGTPNQEQMKQMMQTLLGERFRLSLHRDSRELPIYKLTVAKGGFKLRPLKEGDCIVFDPTHPPSSPKLTASDFCGNLTMGRGTFEGTSASMTDLVTSLSQIVGRPAVDGTGIAGLFHIRLKFAVLSGPPAEADNAAASTDNLPSIFAAVEEQLGLKLESTKGPVDVLVIDRIERPSEN